MLRTLARRAASRVARERDRTSPPAARVEAYEVARPAEETREARPRIEPPLVTESCLRDIPSGGTFAVAPRARITAAAQDEAHRRGIRFVEHVPGASGGLRPSAGTARIAVSSDHGGFELKGALVSSIGELGHLALDLGPGDDQPCDWSEQAHQVALAVAEGRADLGVVIDTVGVGSTMAANKVPGVRAANCWEPAIARNAREHNHANVLVLGSRHLTRLQAHEILTAFLSTPLGGGRHARRVSVMERIEAQARRPR